MAARSAVPRFHDRRRDADVDALRMLGLVDVLVPFMLSEIPLGHPVAHRPPVLRGVDERGSSLDQHADVRQALRSDADGDLRVPPQVDDVFGAWLADDPQVRAVPLVPDRNLIGTAVAVDRREDGDDRAGLEEGVEGGLAERGHGRAPSFWSVAWPSP